MKIEDKRIQDLESIVKTQCENGNWNCNSYMWGMANGLILALATINNEEPVYLEKPDVWLDDLRVDSDSEKAIATF